MPEPTIKPAVKPTIQPAPRPAATPAAAPAPPKAALKWPTIEQCAKGSIAEVNRHVEQFSARFTYADGTGAPEAAVRELLADQFPAGHIMDELVKAYREYEKARK